MLQRHRQKLTDFLNDIEGAMPPIASPPMPQAHDSASILKALLEGHAALIQGVNDLRANVVTRRQLQAFQELQTMELPTYVQAELVPAHETFIRISTHLGSIADRVNHIESPVNSGGASGARASGTAPKIYEPHPVEELPGSVRSFHS